MKYENVFWHTGTKNTVKIQRALKYTLLHHLRNLFTLTELIFPFFFNLVFDRNLENIFETQTAYIEWGEIQTSVVYDLVCISA